MAGQQCQQWWSAVEARREGHKEVGGSEGDGEGSGGDGGGERGGKVRANTSAILSQCSTPCAFECAFVIASFVNFWLSLGPTVGLTRMRQDSADRALFSLLVEVLGKSGRNFSETSRKKYRGGSDD